LFLPEPVVYEYRNAVAGRPWYTPVMSSAARRESPMPNGRVRQRLGRLGSVPR